jgi:hypothetical protein
VLDLGSEYPEVGFNANGRRHVDDARGPLRRTLESLDLEHIIPRAASDAGHSTPIPGALCASLT